MANRAVMGIYVISWCSSAKHAHWTDLGQRNEGEVLLELHQAGLSLFKSHEGLGADGALSLDRNVDQISERGQIDTTWLVFNRLLSNIMDREIDQIKSTYPIDVRTGDLLVNPSLK